MTEERANACEACVETQQRVNEALATSDACWRMEQEVIVRERDEARRDLGEILAVIHRDGGHHTGEHGVSQSVADAHATWAAVVRERDEAQAEVADLSNKYTESWKCSLDVPKDPCFDCIRCLRLRLKGRP